MYGEEAGAVAGGLIADLPHHRTHHPYSIRRALAMGYAASERSGLESEVSQEICRRLGRNARGIWIPHDAPLTGRRSLNLSTTGSGNLGTIIPTRTLIDGLRSKMVMARLGAKISDFGEGLGGNVSMPVKQASAAIAWVFSEGAPAPSQSNETIRQATLTPHTATAFTDVTRRMLTLGAPGFLEFAEDDLIKSMAVAVDAAALAGSGSGGQPIGLFALPGIPTVAFAADIGNGASPDYSTLCSMEAIAGFANADSDAEVKMGWVTSPYGRSALRRAPFLGSSGTARACWECEAGAESMLGWPAVSTTNAPYGLTRGSSSTLTALLFGNFADVVIQLWPAVDVLVNPYLQSTSGIVRLTIYQDVDTVAFRHVSFVAAPAMSIA